MNYTIKLGSNIIEDCDAALVIDGVEVFRLRERTGDGRFVVDFKIQNKAGETLIVVAKNNVVHAAEGFTVKNLAREARVEGGDGKIYVRVLELESNHISIEGEFCVNGVPFSATPEKLLIGGISVYGNHLSRGGKAVVIERGQFVLGRR